MVPDVGQRFLRAFGNLAQQKPLETSQFECFSLFLIQGCQPLLNDRPSFPKRQAAPRDIQGIEFGDFTFANLVPVIEIPVRQVPPAAQTPVVGILENPCFGAALGRIKLSRFVEDFKKDFLHYIFRLTWIAKDPHRNFQNQPVKAIKQDR